MLLYFFVNTVVSERGRPEEDIRATGGLPGVGSLGIIDVSDNLIKWINVVRTRTRDGQGGPARYRIVLGIPDSSVPLDHNQISMKTVRRKSFPIFGKVIGVNWEATNENLQQLATLFSDDPDIDQLVTRSGDISIYTHPNKFQGWTIEVSSRNFFPMQDDWDAIKKIAKDEGLPLKVIELDVDNENSTEEAIKSIIEEKQRIDVLVNNAGWGIWGTAEDVSLEEFREQFETNFFSVVRMIQKVSPIMRKQGSGNIVNISSVAGRIGFPVSTAYISSKFALEGLSESLRFELGQFGINVIIIEPGVIKTNFFDSMKTAKKADESDIYRDITLKVISGVKMMAEMGTPPKEVANVIINSIKEEKPLPRYVVGNDAAMFLEAKKMKTDIEFENYLKKELYGE